MAWQSPHGPATARERRHLRRPHRGALGGLRSDADTRGGRPRPLGLIGAVGLVLLVEAAIARHALDVTPSVTYSWTLSGASARAEAPGHPVLAFGDSLMKHGFQPRVVGQRLGRSAYNLAAPAAPAPVSYFLLCRALEAGAAPEAIVVDFAPDILAGNPDESRRNWPELLTTGEWLDLAWAYGDADFFARSLIDRLMPSVRARFELRAGVRAALAGSSASPREQTLDLRHHWRANAGGNLAPKNPLWHGIVTEDEHRRLMSGGFRCHRVNAAYVDRFFALTARRGIPVYWLLPPVSPALTARRAESGAEAAYSEWVTSCRDRYPHVTVLDARGSGYGPEVFVDARHLDRDGAITLSVAIAQALPPRPGGLPDPAWVHLPAYHPVETGLALEDIHQSSRSRRAAMTR